HANAPPLVPVQPPDLAAMTIQGMSEKPHETLSSLQIDLREARSNWCSRLQRDARCDCRLTLKRTRDYRGEKRDFHRRLTSNQRIRTARRAIRLCHHESVSKEPVAFRDDRAPDRA